MLFDERQHFIPMGQALVVHKLFEKDITPNRAQPKGDRIENEPEDDVFCGYRWPAFLFSVFTKVSGDKNK